MFDQPHGTDEEAITIQLPHSPEGFGNHDP
jgi:hypothetical protein